MGIINILDASVASKISAGEVVERPASVVKELIENSIDAGSKNIILEVKNAGKKLIKVTDDGCGMTKNDAVLCIERYATSKLRTIEDLNSLITLGFRGEALASISAVSKLQIVTRPRDQSIGTLVEVWGGEIIDVRDTGCKEGTTVTVKDLFYNTPARLKFLKRDSIEFNNIYNIFYKLMLSHPEISFKLISDDKLKLSSTGDGNLLNCIKTIWGQEIADHMIEVKAQDRAVKVTGYISDRSVIRRSKNDILFFVNKRCIINKALYAAVLDVYKQYLTTGTYPVIVLNIDIDPRMIDVNIHPTKLELKFSDEHGIYGAMYNALNNALNPKSEVNRPLTSIFNINDFEKQGNVEIETKYEQVKLKETDIRDINELENEINIAVDEVINEGMIFYDDDIKYLGQVLSTYLLCEKDNELYIIDQHAAHERILYEKYIKEFKNNRISSQRLLIPTIIELKNDEKNIVIENINLFNTLGYEIDDFGETAIAIRAVPIFFDQTQARLFIDECVAYLSSDSNRTSIDEMLFKKACKAAVKANDSLTEKEARELIKSLLSCENPYNCPHGRPTIVRFTKSDMDKMFKRVI
ncbi:DNA mismatch repair protein MutL [Caldanaerobius fijiensis DSM 17918]|uniref:DNA mismatch repair protein MutL n=1 Tax=Caldanaerobius fijiensis DSM 17918 TaxID=1121256 RepID=A0A1M4YER7_9THEO|nr:DNA mismatch repair endonuclease MutL [Caldanaerobius fijiensis]SHF04219.1 DNA mismatch repair protein MutL [Caldanaerobius fijiensis DSM 17918]